MAFNKNVIPFDPIESSPGDGEAKSGIRKHSNRNLIKKPAEKSIEPSEKEKTIEK